MSADSQAPTAPSIFAWIQAARPLAAANIALPIAFGSALAYGDQPIGLTQSALAELAGTVRQTANRVIREGAEAGVLVAGRGSLQIIDPKRLAELAESAG